MILSYLIVSSGLNNTKALSFSGQVPCVTYV
jgi:hypothetical protein